MLDIIIRTDGADIGIAGEKIAIVVPGIMETAKEEIDATGLLVLPGVIDPHVHFNEPGRADWEGFVTGSRAASAGGVTTYFDMPLNSTPVTTTVAAFEAKRALGEQKSMVDFGLWGGLTPDNLDDLHPLAEAGVIGFKAFMCDSGLPEFPAIDDASLLEGMQRIADTGLRLALHAERFTGPIRAAGAREEKPRSARAAYAAQRPIQAELDAIGFAVVCARKTGCPIHIVHVSNAPCIDFINAARTQGTDITCETCPHYFFFGDQPDDTLAKCSPPIRSAEEQAALWERVEMDRIDWIASDHSPCPPAMKDRPYQAAWGGISSVQHGLPLLWTSGLFEPDQLAALMAGNTAETFRLPGKGHIKAGYDADIVLLEMGAEETIEAESLLYRHAHSAYTGRRVTARIARTMLRGQSVYAEGACAVAPAGKWIRPQEI